MSLRFCEGLSGIFLESLLWPRVSPQFVTLWYYQKGHLHSRWSGQMKVASAERYCIMAEEKCCKSWLHSRNHLCKDRKLRHLPEQCPTKCGPLRILQPLPPPPQLVSLALTPRIAIAQLCIFQIVQITAVSLADTHSSASLPSGELTCLLNHRQRQVFVFMT